MSTTWRRIRPIVLAAWLVAAIRFVLEFTVKPEPGQPASFVSVYFLVKVALLVVGIRSLWGAIPLKGLLAATGMIAVLCFLVPNAIVYTTGQFQGWTHGRFRPPEAGKTGFGEDPESKAAPVENSTVGKIGAGLSVAALTTVGGFIWSTVLGLLFVYVPGRVRARKSAAT